MAAETRFPEPPVDLAREPDFLLGETRVLPSIREIVRGNLRESLEPRVMQVLVALFRAEGRVVSRDELIARCWEGRLVGEDAINRVISLLRRISETDNNKSFTIATIARVGYRLLPARPHAAPRAAAMPPGAIPADATSISNRVMRRYLAMAVAALVAITAATAWWLWPAPHWTVESSHGFLATPAQEAYPAFSPDGKILAYSRGPEETSHQVYVRYLAGGDSIKISKDAYDDVSPSWASDGMRLAYIAQKTGEPCRIMVASVPAAITRLVGRCARAETGFVTWRPGTSLLYYTDQTETGAPAIFQLDLETGARKLIVESDRAEVGFWDPHCSPDGKSLLYVLQESNAPQPIVIRDLASGQERIVARNRAIGGTIGSAAWTEDSRTVLVSNPHALSSEIIAYPVDGNKAYPLYTTATIVGRLAMGGGKLALETDISRGYLARASLTPRDQPDIIDQTIGVTLSPSFAPDGTLAFLSNRSGATAVWIIKPGAAPSLLYSYDTLTAMVRTQFSPDGNRLAVVTGPTDLSYNTIKVLTREGTSIASFNVPPVGFGSPTWTPDGNSLILFDRKAQRSFRIAIDNPTRRAPVADKGWGAIAMQDGAMFAARADRPGLWRIDKQPVLISSKYPAAFHPPIAFRGDDILVPDFEAADRPRILAQPKAGGPDRVLAYAPGAVNRGNSHTKVTVNPMTGEMVYSAAYRDTNIDLLTLAKR